MTDYMEDHEREAMLDSILCKREDRGQEPTKYVAPGKDQKWRARELFGFMWRHLGIKIPQGYRDVMLFLIEKANAKTGRVDWRQNKIANVMMLSRDYVNEAFKWWASETPYLKTARRQNKEGWYLSNSYHIRWKETDAAWATISVNTDLLNSDFLENGRNPDVDSDSTTVVDSDSATDVDSDSATRNTKEKCKVEEHHEMAHKPSACVAIYENQSSLESQSSTSPNAESQKNGLQEEKATPENPSSPLALALERLGEGVREKGNR